MQHLLVCAHIGSGGELYVCAAYRSLEVFSLGAEHLETGDSGADAETRNGCRSRCHCPTHQTAGCLTGVAELAYLYGGATHRAAY